MREEPNAVLAVESMSAGYGAGRGATLVLDNIDLTMAAGQTVGVVGESGSGKSTLGKVIVGQIAPSAGRVVVAGQDLTRLRGAALRKARRLVQLIPQDPYASLNPRMVVGHTLQEAVNPTRRLRRANTEEVSELLEAVALEPDAAQRYPHEFSGGQRQRIAIARALAVGPRLLVADEVTSALDASVQAEILNLLRDVQLRTGVSCLFITHDLEVAAYVSDQICVMYQGRIVERGDHHLMRAPQHPYTQRLATSAPSSLRLRD